MKKIAFFILCTVLSISSLNAEERISVVTEYWHPYNYLNSEGDVVGESTDFVKKVMEISGLEYSIQLHSWDDSFAFARTRNNVLLYSIVKTPIRAKLFHWFCPISKPIHQSAFRLSSRDDINVKSKGDFTDFTFSITRGTFPKEILAKHGVIEGENLQLVATSDRNLQMLLLGRVDLIVEADDAIYQILKNKGHPLTYITKVYSFDGQSGGELCMALNINTPMSLVEKIKNAHTKALTLYYPH